jgi:hypothetical protein
MFSLICERKVKTEKGGVLTYLIETPNKEANVGPKNMNLERVKRI